MENIAPLARVLAEGNGLEWQQIKGTGAGGQITEDDVLNHLSLIMSGEMEPPSTPVDPEPSPAELATIASSEMLSRAGVDSDLTDLLKMQEDARAALKAQGEATSSTPSADDFELDDDSEDMVEPAVQPAAQQTPAAPPAGAVMGGILSSLYKQQDQQPAEPPASSQPAAFAVPEAPVPAYNPDFSAPVQQPAYQEPAYQQPAYQEPSYQEPAYQEQTYQEPTQQEPAPPAYQEYQQPAAPYGASSPASGEWKGVYLRRDANIAAAEEARSQLAEVLGDLPLSVLVARAAQKSAASLGLSSVAIANSSGEALNASLSGDLRASLSGLHDAATGRMADLLVVNAGELDLDDLHFPHAVTLSLGRVTDGKAALSLNGDVDPQQGARFLSDVAALLATPVKLLV